MSTKPGWFGEPLEPRVKWRWLGLVLDDQNLSTSAKVIAAILFYRHNPSTGRLDPGIGHLAALASLSRRGAQRARDQLVVAGYLEKTRRRIPGSAGNLTNAYRLTTPQVH